MTNAYDPLDWFWVVGGDISKAWSSAAGGYVTDYPQDRVTDIESEDDLTDVLRPFGVLLPKPIESDYADAVQEVINATAKERGYSDGIALASYVSSTNPAWAAEAKTFIAWRDSVWVSTYSLLEEVQSGAPQPTISALVASLPKIDWPK